MLCIRQQLRITGREETISVRYVLCNLCPYKVSQKFDLPGGYVKAFGEGQCYILHFTVPFISLS